MHFVKRDVFRPRTDVVPTTRPFSSLIFVLGGAASLSGALIGFLSLAGAGGTAGIGGALDIDFIEIRANADVGVDGVLSGLIPAPVGASSPPFSGSLVGSLSLVNVSSGASTISGTLNGVPIVFGSGATPISGDLVSAPKIFGSSSVPISGALTSGIIVSGSASVPLGGVMAGLLDLAIPNSAAIGGSLTGALSLVTISAGRSTISGTLNANPFVMGSGNAAIDGTLAGVIGAATGLVQLGGVLVGTLTQTFNPIPIGFRPHAVVRLPKRSKPGRLQ